MTVPETADFIEDFPTSTCILYVPKNAVENYKHAYYWNEFAYILPIEGGEEKPEAEACSTPTISYKDGALKFESSTPGAEYHYTLTVADVANDKYNKEGTVELAAKYDISAYATADGYKPSEKAEATLYWIPTSDATNINTTKTRGVVASCRGGVVEISRLNSAESVSFYTEAGQLIGTTTAVDGTVQYAIGTENDMVIAKFGSASIKIAVK